MSVLQQKKRAEGAELVKQADKCLAKKSFFRASPDYLSAAPLLEKAAEAFRAGEDFEACKRAFTQAAAARLQTQSPFRAAQNHENLAKVALQQLKTERAGGGAAQQRTAEARKAYETASSCYVDMGEFGKAADALVKGAAACEAAGMGVDSVLPLFQRACELLEAQDKPHFAVDTFRKTLGFLVKHAQYQEALRLLDRMVTLFEAMDQPANVHKSYLSQVILLLGTGDVPAADALYSRCLQEDAFLNSDECALAEDLVRAFKLGNEELLQTTIRKPGFLSLDNQIGRLSRKLSVLGGGMQAPAAPAKARPVHRSQQQQQQQQQSAPKQRNPFAPAARAAPTQRNPFAPSTHAAPAPSLAAPAPAPVAAASVYDEYDVASVPPTASSSGATQDSDYEAALAAALGETSVSSSSHNVEPKLKPTQAEAPAPAPAPEKVEAPQHAQPESPKPLPSPVQADRRTQMDFDMDSLEFAMPDSDSLEFTMPEDNYSYDYDAAATSTAPVSKPEAKPEAKPKAVEEDDDMFDLT